MSRYIVLIFENQGKQSHLYPFFWYKKGYGFKEIVSRFYMIQNFYGVDFLVDFIITKQTAWTQWNRFNQWTHPSTTPSPYSHSSSISNYNYSMIASYVIALQFTVLSLPPPRHQLSLYLVTPSPYSHSSSISNYNYSMIASYVIALQFTVLSLPPPRHQLSLYLVTVDIISLSLMALSD